MRVAVIIDTWFPFIGGGQINAWEISKRIAKEDISIDIITRNNGHDNLQLSKNLKVFKLGPKAAADDTISKIAYLVRSFLFVYKKKYDLVHAHAFLPGITARLLMISKGIPAILTVHGTSIGTGLLSLLSEYVEKFLLTQVRYSTQITVSRDFLKIKNINKKIIYIPNGIDIDRFDRIQIQKAIDSTLIFVGRLHPQKNLETLIQAVAILTKDFPDIQLLIVGNGKQKALLKKLIQTLHLKNHVKLLGQKSGLDLIRLYKSSNIFILPSIYEGQPLTLLEAWAAKLPVIVSNTGDCQYLVKDGKNGYLINNILDSIQIAKVIKKALIDKNTNKMGQNGYNLVKKYSWEKSAQETFKVYETFRRP
ncbi:hypothetical protein A3H26_01570 [candidate division WWE3 bacterium RIFCSPLOWO2_12_FULL_36_10]|uniref:Glycosyl transferase family 1 n=1 Tax=candidate division WWE3 bacterium RIFCSPLOWO2_12_FULL_36_10 TaxID=1802630 RepID=A0A1F4VLL6_UNCKA|nr:MAG: hypothetical protein A3H26_01570 [candidate division WWE3 bacterium RIFCSPLOWO2_12_FULL_36_10]